MHPYAFHAVVAAATLLLQRHSKDLNVQTACSKMLQIHRAIAIRLINEEIARLWGSVPSDDLILAIISVASEPTAPGLTPLDECQLSKSPLATAQNIHYYSTQFVDPEYIPAFFRVVALKGGLSGIETPALATLAELYVAFASYKLPRQAPC